jgi:hypothetical protein
VGIIIFSGPPAIRWILGGIGSGALVACARSRFCLAVAVISWLLFCLQFVQPLKHWYLAKMTRHLRFDTRLDLLQFYRQRDAQGLAYEFVQSLGLRLSVAQGVASTMLTLTEEQVRSIIEN